MMASASVGADVSLTDLYPDEYPSADRQGSRLFYVKALEPDAPSGGSAQGGTLLISAEEKDARYRA